jgi:hypothetical protein
MELMIDEQSLNRMAECLAHGADGCGMHLERMRQELAGLARDWSESTSLSCLADIARTLNTLSGTVVQLQAFSEALRTHARETGLTEQGLLDALSALPGERSGSW